MAAGVPELGQGVVLGEYRDERAAVGAELGLEGRLETVDAGLDLELAAAQGFHEHLCCVVLFERELGVCVDLVGHPQQLGLQSVDGFDGCALQDLDRFTHAAECIARAAAGAGIDCRARAGGSVRAVVVDRWMDPSELRVTQQPEPEVVAGSVKIATRAAALNFFDLLIVQGRYQIKPSFPFVPGGEFAGEVIEVGPGVEGLRVGDRVLTSRTLGGYAERAVLEQDACIPMPAGLDFAQAAALPIVYGTSYSALVFRADLQAGETLLVHAAAGGVGLAAVQLGKRLGARVIATAGGPEKLAIAREHGADLAIDYRAEDFVAKVLEATDGRGADVIYDSVGGDTFERSLKCIAWNGRLLVIGFASGTIPSVALNRIMLKNISLVGLNWGGHAQAQPERMQATYDALFELMARGEIQPVVSQRYPARRGDRRARGAGLARELRQVDRRAVGQRERADGVNSAGPRWLAHARLDSGGRDRCLSALTRSDADHVFDRCHEDLSIPDAPGVAGLEQGVRDLLDHRVGHDNLELHLGQEVDHVLGTPVELAVALLASESLDLADGQPLDADPR